jgi:hypothetical protein
MYICTMVIDMQQLQDQAQPAPHKTEKQRDALGAVRNGTDAANCQRRGGFLVPYVYAEVPAQCCLPAGCPPPSSFFPSRTER